MQAPRFGLYPLSLAATDGVSVDFLSSRYLDVSVPWLSLYGLCIHPQMTPSGCPVTPGFPIRRSPDQSLLDSYPRLIAAYHVLHRLSTPRHPPHTLNNLTTLMRDCHAATRMPPQPEPIVRSSKPSSAFWIPRWIGQPPARSPGQTTADHLWNPWFVHIRDPPAPSSATLPRKNRGPPADQCPPLQLSKSPPRHHPRSHKVLPTRANHTY